MTTPYSLVHAFFAVALAAVVPTPALAEAATSAQGLTSSEGNPSISFTTFNIRFYGQNRSLAGSAVSPVQRDQRDSQIRALLDHNGWADVIAFQEIVDLAALQKNLLRNAYNCHGYRHAQKGHQHVTICVRRGLTFERAPDDTNYALEDVAMRTLRPAVHGILKLEGGTAFAHVIAVHLKAMPNMSARRLQQAALLRAYFDRRDSDLPLVVLGDFNTFHDDADRIATTLDLQLVETPFDFTYHDLTFGGSKLDQVYISDTLAVVGAPKLAGPCDDTPADPQEIARYNTEISDHCPVTLMLQHAH